jgi:hypothetical protein
VSSTSATPGYASTNLYNGSKRNLVWRSDTGTGDQWVEVAFGSSKTVLGMVAVNHLIHAGGSLKGQYWTGAAWADLSTFSTPSSNRTRLTHIFPSQATTKVRFYFVNTAAVAQAVELGVAFVVDATGYFAPTRRLSNERSTEPMDPSVMAASLGGQRQFWKRQKTVSLPGRFPAMPQSEADTFQQIWDLVGKTDPIVYCRFPTSLDQSVYGYLPENPSITHVAGSQWDVDLTVDEAA